MTASWDVGGIVRGTVRVTAIKKGGFLLMHMFKVVDQVGRKYYYRGSDMRAVLEVHYMLHRTEVVSAKRKEACE